VGGWHGLYLSLGGQILFNSGDALEYAIQNHIRAAIFSLLFAGLAAVAFILMLQKNRMGLTFSRILLG
jgi:hypothetical protein